ncbi:MAG: response regulator, partial [Myxococcota bacterium]
RILVVDDEPAVRSVARTALVDEGYDVIEAADGRQALEKLAAADVAVDVVLLDLTMPALSGTETLREIKQLFPDTQVILSSGYAEPDALARAGGRQAAAFLPKPYTPVMLTALVRDVVLRRPMSRSG